MPESSFDEPDECAVGRVLEYLAENKPDAAQFARSLLNRGGLVIEAFGPVQMAVHHLRIQYKNWYVVFHGERGRVEAVALRRATARRTAAENYWPIGLAVLAWARSQGVPFRLDRLESLDHDLAAHGIDALDWLDDGNEPVLERLYAVWRDGQRIIWSTTENLHDPQLAADALARLEEAAR
ncbi:hypothetical protein [Cumulibacter soli]|uniref:hypothetical protein n=1 Tax=Cumulibacter soli TaxID=2546344 RepID=UPI001067C344|nr:hypothetical protein [Cumulibacter soli]